MIKNIDIIQKFMIFIHLYGTDGAVLRTCIPNSCSNRCVNTSICKTPKNPHRYPLPNAEL